jgi:hypothetical protein
MFIRRWLTNISCKTLHIIYELNWLKYHWEQKTFTARGAEEIGLISIEVLGCDFEFCLVVIRPT